MSDMMESLPEAISPHAQLVGTELQGQWGETPRGSKQRQRLPAVIGNYRLSSRCLNLQPLLSYDDTAI